VEARDILDQLSNGVLELEKGTGGPDLVPRLLRLSHTLKGAARVVRQPEVADHAHAIEDALAPFREAPAAVPHERIDGLLKLLDAIGGRVAALAAPPGAEPPVRDASRPEEALRTVRTDVAEMDGLLDGVAETHIQITALRGTVRSLEGVRHAMDLLVEQLAARSGRARGPRADEVARDIRSSLGGLERGLAAATDRMDRELRQLRAAAEQLRLVPAGQLFALLERTARDAARSVGCGVVFEGRGSDVRLDAHVLATVQGALLQLVRNAVAHGIEPEDRRRAAGKPAEGRVTLTVARRGRRVVFTCTDDGRGVDLDAVRRAARRWGLSSTESGRLGAEALVRLLLRGGITTSGAVTEVSGRGIGLDVVREATERVGGEVTVHTVAGGGTTVELVVPLSLASLDALVVQAAGLTASIPLEAVRRAFRIAPEDIARTAGGDSVMYDGDVVPFVPLPRLLRDGAGSTRVARPWSAVLVKGATGVAAVGVDRLLGTANVVVRPLPDLAPASRIVAGASLDADGNAQVVLDPDGLVLEAGRAAGAEEQSGNARLPLLVVDDSLTTRMLVRSILESAGFDVDVATSGEEALDMARLRRYAIFLVDVEMPGMDGFAFVDHTRADPALRHTPAILVTSRTSPEDRRRGQEVGAQGYVVKSEFDQVEFLRRVRDLAG
jgi:two-component system chemotaxis sensor kinase CheA